MQPIRSSSSSSSRSNNNNSLLLRVTMLMSLRVFGLLKHSDKIHSTPSSTENRSSDYSESGGNSVLKESKIGLEITLEKTCSNDSKERLPFLTTIVATQCHLAVLFFLLFLGFLVYFDISDHPSAVATCVFCFTVSLV